jgi:hypothetical protein
MLPTWSLIRLLQRLGRLVFPDRADQRLNCVRLSLSERDPDSDGFANPEQLLGERGMHCECVFALLFGEKEMNVLLVRRDGNKDLAAHPEGAVVMVRLFRDFWQRKREPADRRKPHVRGLTF